MPPDIEDFELLEKDELEKDELLKELEHELEEHELKDELEDEVRTISISISAIRSQAVSFRTVSNSIFASCAAVFFTGQV